MAVPVTPGDRPRVSALGTFLVLSLLLHAALLAGLRGARLSLGDAEPPPIVVKLAPPSAPPKAPPAAAPPRPEAPGRLARTVPPKEQIVAPSDRENDLPPLAGAFLSDRDNRVERETVRRGNPEAGTPEPQAPPEQAASPARPEPPPPGAASREAPRAPAKGSRRDAAPAPPRSGAAAARPSTALDTQATNPAPLPGLDKLLAPPAEVLARADTAPGPQEAARLRHDDPHRDLLGAPPPATGLFGGPRGTFDDLPDVAQGSLTLLNTKADRFAPFVRRVGTRVFQNMIINQRRDLSLEAILAAHNTITVRVTLDPTGKLKNIDVEERSGSLAVDQTLLEALRQAAFDQNPPASAANPKGEYEFLFQAQLAAAFGPGPGGQQVRAVESRLRVGLL